MSDRNTTHGGGINLILVTIMNAVILMCETCNCISPMCSSALIKAVLECRVREAKADSVFWYDIWISAGRSKTGTLQQIRLSCKAKYKLGIKNEYAKFEHNLLNEMQIRTLENLGKLGTLNQKK